ncbi:MAG: glycosyltransferase family 9 protein [Bryobacterales bacterium]|nr:glycosyltransferase family 9 protein [Bryobacterales bacterium]
MRRLFIRPGAIGDCLCWLPTLAAIGTRNSAVWAPGPVLPLLELAAQRRNLAATGFSLLGVPGAKIPEQTIEALRGFDEILSWSGCNQPELRQACLQMGLPIHFFASLPDPLGSEHVSDWYLRQTREWHGLGEEPPAWRAAGGRRFLMPAAAAPIDPAAPLRIVLHPYSGSARKNWPINAYRRLAESIAASTRGRFAVQWCASADDPLPEDLARGAWRFPDLGDLARALCSAALFVGNDSGVTHLAAMLGVPTVAFFGPMRPEVWSPRGAAVHIVRSDQADAPATEIPFERGEHAVLSAIERLIAFSL